MSLLFYEIKLITLKITNQPQRSREKLHNYSSRFKISVLGKKYQALDITISFGYIRHIIFLPFIPHTH